MRQLLVLHGALGSADQLAPLADAFLPSFAVHRLNFAGHGGNTESTEAFSIAGFAEQVLHWLKENRAQKVILFGYSMGGYVALYLAANHPELVESVVTLGTKFQWDEETAAKEILQLNPALIEEKLPAFAAQLQQRHQPASWMELVQKTAILLQDMGRQPPLDGAAYKRISCPVLLLLGDRDKMVSLEETLAVFRQLSPAQLGVLPATPHPVEKVDLQQLVFLVKRFLK